MYERYKTTSGSITVKNGDEGPRHDPYSFVEYTVERKGKRKTTIHLGLVVWCKVEGRPVKKTMNEAKARERFARYVGWPLEEVERAVGLADRRRERSYDLSGIRAAERAAGWDASP